MALHSAEKRLTIPLPGNEDLARAIAAAGDYQLGSLETRNFPDGESYLRFLDDVEGRDVNLICTLAHPNDNFLPVIFAADAAREFKARSVNLVTPYLAYMRQDKRFNAGEAITSRTFARLVSSSFDSLLTIDPHLHRYHALSEIYTIPATSLASAPVLAKWISHNIEKPLLIGPDEESEQWVSQIGKLSGAPFTVLRKTRYGDRNVEIHMGDLSQWQGRTPVLVDDIASSGRTMVEAARQLAEQGLAKPVCVVVHGLFADDAYERLSAIAEKVVSTDCVPHISNKISVAELLVEAINAAEKEGA
ncbi:ribose-phosphate pyrophosphokinase [Bacillus subtilis]|uniref:ribose-phosphate pyrophosphokinase n=1 Tax=Pseudochrobactrum asaccharolyticum TaxID=354351 RepID=UPI001F450570|nr:ribose-phosphate pyrophosphokinase [Pseudochrobactrum asaccharolyticum]MCF7645384.1 ribose-phosphate pyrophosphokinase [Pseudochrobactrum asaccharolyticum]MCF7671996.1 ribose-phosphate pyrophosphokinase [Bacillus subtilis]